jgi:hypothetical protein
MIDLCIAWDSSRRVMLMSLHAAAVGSLYFTFYINPGTETTAQRRAPGWCSATAGLRRLLAGSGPVFSPQGKVPGDRIICLSGSRSHDIWTTLLSAFNRIEVKSGLGKPLYFAIRPIAKEMIQMTSKTHKIKIIRKHKRRANKANRKVDQKRIDQNHAFLFPKAG